MTMNENDKQAEPVAWVKLTPQQLLDAYMSGKENRPPGMKHDALHICGIVCVQAAVLAAQKHTHPAQAVAAQNPNCGSCPGDGSVCEESCRVADESPAVGQEPVAYTNKEQLGYLKDPKYSAHPMAMWASKSPGSDIALYTEAPSVAVNELKHDLEQHVRIANKQAQEIVELTKVNEQMLEALKHAAPYVFKFGDAKGKADYSLIVDAIEAHKAAKKGGV